MSLVPIIYTSLILFFGLLFIFVIVSFLSFKARGKKNPVIEAEILKQKRIIQPPKLIVNRIPQNSFTFLEQNLEVRDKSIKTKSSDQPIVLPYDYFNKEQRKPKSYNTIIKRNTERIDEQKRNSRLQKTMMNKSRIEVMNENIKYRTNEVYKTDKKTSRANYINDLSQFNILSFYSDNSSENNFVTATAIPARHAV
ncbi:MAG: hypothetical protein RDU14_15185 [Melioribacteraceae bacterium]|nr:hypothetical protein [Melioribacteraceae bacterium]